MHIAIITRADDSSPKVLAQGLQHMLEKINIQADMFFETGMLMRLTSAFAAPKHPTPLSKRMYTRIKNYKHDKTILNKLKAYDAIIVSECSPNGFWKNYYNIEKLRKITQKPIVFYEVYYLGNAPTQIEKLKQNLDPLCQRYNWHLSVSEVTEIRQTPSINLKWSNIGLNLENTNLSHEKKDDFIALVDFAQPGYEKYREEQIRVLEELAIPYINLQGRYPMHQLREMYNTAAVYFMQSTEAFGVPIAELLATGAYIFTPDSAWPMSWRLDKNPQIHASGQLPDVFKVYSDTQNLEKQLLQLKQNWHPKRTPKQVFSKFTAVYPQFYYGNLQSLKQALKNMVNA